MTEKEKRDLGFLYDANYDKELAVERVKCQDMCYEYNNLKPSQMNEQYALMKKILGSTKNSFYVTPPFWCDYGYTVKIGENFYSNHNLTLVDGGQITFGDNVFIAPNCVFTTAGHALDTEQRNRGLEFAYPITVGDNVWFGAGVIVLPGVSIGSDTVIGAGSVVTKDIPSGVVAVGNPCRVLRKITPADADKYPIAK